MAAFPTNQSPIPPMPEMSEVERLKAKIAFYEQDPFWNYFFSLVRKQNELSQSMNEVEIKLDGDDKTFDRFLKLVEKSEMLTSAISKLRTEYLKNPDEETIEAAKKNVPILEQHVTGRKNNKR